MNIDNAAQTVHETIRAFAASIGESMPSWAEAPEWQRTATDQAIRSHFAAFDEGREVPPSESHDKWCADKLAAGWKYGAVKDSAAKTHPLLIPYDELPLEQKMKDYLIGAVCLSFHKAGVKL